MRPGCVANSAIAKCDSSCLANPKDNLGARLALYMMNRLQLWPEESPLETAHEHPVQPAVLTTPQSDKIAYRNFVPLHYEPKYAYPLLIWLHGAAADEHQLQQIMPLVSLRNYVGIGPRGNCQDPANTNSHCWDDSADAMLAAERTIFECIELAKRQFNIHPDRIFLAGFERGRTTALRVGLRHPGRFAGALSIGGPFPDGSRPLAKINEARSLPLFIAQGRDSHSYPLERSCQEIRLFHAAGMIVTLRQYPCGDELTTQMLHDMDVWTMEQVTGVRNSSDESTLPLN